MRNIVLARIDDRLIHGQVVTAWLKVTDGNYILIPDDKLPNDMLMKRVLAAAAPAGVTLKIMPIDEAAAFLKEDSPAGEKVVILGKYPVTFERLLQQGVEIKDLVLGGMVNNPQRKPFIKQCAATEEEKESMRRIINDHGVHMYFQLVPGQTVIEVKDHL